MQLYMCVCVCVCVCVPPLYTIYAAINLCKSALIFIPESGIAIIKYKQENRALHGL